MSQLATATEPGEGIVHYLLTDRETLCEKNAEGWSRQQTGLEHGDGTVLWCPECRQAKSELSVFLNGLVP